MKRETEKKIFVFRLKLKDCKKDFGFGSGVLAVSDVMVVDKNRLGWDSPMLAKALLDAEEEMIRDNIEVVMEEKR